MTSVPSVVPPFFPCCVCIRHVVNVWCIHEGKGREVSGKGKGNQDKKRIKGETEIFYVRLAMYDPWCLSLSRQGWRLEWQRTSTWSCSSSRGRWSRCLRPIALCPPVLTHLTPLHCTAQENPQPTLSLQCSQYTSTILPHHCRCCVYIYVLW